MNPDVERDARDPRDVHEQPDAEQLAQMQQYQQQEIPGSSQAEIVSLIFAAVMILATVGCFIWLI